MSDSSCSDKAAANIKDEFVGRDCIIHISDGRAFQGTFICVDSDINVILANTDEISYLTGSSGQDKTTRNVGMVMVPGNHIVRVEVQQDVQSNLRGDTAILEQPSQSNLLGEAGQSIWPDNDSLYT